MRDISDGFFGLGRASPTLQHAVVLARKIASDRSGAAATPSSRDLLFATCSLDPQLAESLRKSGLQLGDFGSHLLYVSAGRGKAAGGNWLHASGAVDPS